MLVNSRRDAKLLETSPWEEMPNYLQVYGTEN